jgi:hypothetical protein
MATADLHPRIRFQGMREIDVYRKVEIDWFMQLIEIRTGFGAGFG